MEGMQGTPESRRRLDDLMNERRRELRIKWTEVARRAGMTPQNLLRIRKGQISISWDAADGIDDALQWERGGVQAIIDGRIPVKLLVARPQDPELRDENERRIWALDGLDEDLRREYISRYRNRKNP